VGFSSEPRSAAALAPRAAWWRAPPLTEYLAVDDDQETGIDFISADALQTRQN
jgi:hypothetical protein